MIQPSDLDFTGVRRIHLSGGPGSGKSWLARRLGSQLNLPVFELDGLVLDVEAVHGNPFRTPEGRAAVASLVSGIIARDRWLTDGAYLGWAEEFIAAADLVIHMDTAWSVASRRILVRHVKRDLQRRNRFPGWRRLYSFWRWSSRYYAGTNPHSLNPYGNPETIGLLREGLRRYESKLVVCRSKRDLSLLLKVATQGNTGL